MTDHEKPNEFIVIDFWRKVILLCMTSQLQGKEVFDKCRIQIGQQPKNKDESNVNFDIENFFVVKSKHHDAFYSRGTGYGTDLEPADPLHNLLETVFIQPTGREQLREHLETVFKELPAKEPKCSLVTASLAKFLGKAQTTKNKNKRVYDTAGFFRSGITGGDFKPGYEYRDAKGQYLYRVAVAFGFCPKKPRKHLNPRWEERSTQDQKWIDEQGFDPSSFDKGFGDSDQDRLTQETWLAFAGNANETGKSLGESFEIFFDRWCNMVYHEDPKLRRGVCVSPDHRVIRLYDSPKNIPGDSEYPRDLVQKPEVEHRFELGKYNTTKAWLRRTNNGSLDLSAEAHDPEKRYAFKGFFVHLHSENYLALEEAEDEDKKTECGSCMIMRRSSKETKRLKMTVMVEALKGEIPNRQIFGDLGYQVMRHKDVSAAFSVNVLAKTPRKWVVSPGTGADQREDALSRIKWILDHHQQRENVKEHLTEEDERDILIYVGTVHWEPDET